VKPIRIAQIEARSWGGHPRSYSLDFRFPGSSQTIVDIIKPWQKLECEYHLYLISDDLCLSKIPHYIPKSKRIALLKESHLLPRIYDKSSIPLLLKNFNLILTHHHAHLSINRRFRMLPYSSNLIGIHPYVNQSRLPSANEKTKLCSAVLNIGTDAFSSQALLLRSNVINHLTTCSDIDLFGKSTRPITNKITLIF